MLCAPTQRTISNSNSSGIVVSSSFDILSEERRDMLLKDLRTLLLASTSACAFTLEDNEEIDRADLLRHVDSAFGSADIVSTLESETLFRLMASRAALPCAYSF